MTGIVVNGEVSNMTKPASKGKGIPAEARIRSRNEAKILHSAVQLFAAKGFDGTRLREIAEHCGLPRANLYYYFSSKEGIYTTLIEQLLARWDRAFEHIRADREPSRALEDYICAKLEYSRTHAVESRFFANEILRGGKFLTHRHRSHMQQITEQRAEVVRGWIRQGKLVAIDPYHLFIMLWSATQFYADYGFVAARTLDKQRLTRKDFATAAETIAETVLHGCCTADKPASCNDPAADSSRPDSR